jgi:CRISPR-associated protein Cas7/Cst2/DevR subtype I-B
VLETLKYLWGGGRQTRFLVNLTPQFIIYARMHRKVPIFLNCLNAEYSNGSYKIKTDIIKETIKDYSDDIENVIVGIRTGQFVNANDDFNQLHSKVHVTTVGDAINSMIADIQTAKL